MQCAAEYEPDFDSGSEEYQERPSSYDKKDDIGHHTRGSSKTNRKKSKIEKKISDKIKRDKIQDGDKLHKDKQHDKISISTSSPRRDNENASRSPRSLTRSESTVVSDVEKEDNGSRENEECIHRDTSRAPELIKIDAEEEKKSQYLQESGIIDESQKAPKTTDKEQDEIANDSAQKRRHKHRHRKHRHRNRELDEDRDRQDEAAHYDTMQDKAEADEGPKKRHPRKCLRRKMSWRDANPQLLKEQENKGPYVWDSEHKGLNMTVCPENPHMVRREVASQSTDAVMGCHGYSIGYHVFPVHFNDKPWGTHCTIGICTRKTEMHSDNYTHLIGHNKHSWGWDIPTCTLYHKGKSRGRFPRKAQFTEVPRSFSLILDLFNGVLSFDFGNENVEEAFTDLPEGTTFYPAVALVYGLSEVSIWKEGSDAPAVPTSREPTTSETVSEVQAELEEPTQAERDKEDELKPKVEGMINGEYSYGRAKKKTRKSRVSFLSKNKRDSESTKSVEHQSEEDAQGVLASGDDEEVGAHVDNNVALTTHSSLTQSHIEGTKDDGQDLSNKQNDELNTDDQGNKRASHDRHKSEIPSSEEKKSDHVYTIEPIDDSTLKSFHREPTDYELYGCQLREDSYVAKDIAPNEPEPTYKGYNKHDSSLNRHDSTWSYSSYYEKMRTQIEEDSEEEEEDQDVRYTQVSDLSEEDQEIIRLAHGWDFVNRGGLLSPHPNVPNVCVPQPSLNGKVQAIRGKRGFKKRSGCHVWRVQEQQFFCPWLLEAGSTEEQIDTAASDILVGVASSEYRVYNSGFMLSHLGPHAWGFEPTSKLLWHNRYFYSPDDMAGSNHGNQPQNNPASILAKDVYRGEGLNCDQHIEARNGLYIELDTHRNTLTFRYNGDELCTVKKVKGDILYPFLLYNKEAYFPVEMEYLSGPADYIEEVLREVREMAPAEQKELVSNFRCLYKRSSSRIGTQLTDPAVKGAYIWGAHSPKVEISFINKNQISVVSHTPEVAIAEYSVSCSRHRVDFTVEGHVGCLVLGIVGNSFKEGSVVHGYTQGHSTPYTLGDGMHSWAWDVTNRSLYHAGRKLGKYPVFSDVDLTTYRAFRLTLDFSPLGYNTASFTALDPGSKVKEYDLGIAFVGLANELKPAVAVAGKSGEKIAVKMEYYAGPWNMNKIKSAQTKEPGTPQSQACIVL